jgi:hypothetical protein
MSNHRFDVDAFLADEAEQERRDIETVRRMMADQRPGLALNYRELWRKHWTWIVVFSIGGAVLFWLAGFLRAL